MTALRELLIQLIINTVNINLAYSSKDIFTDRVLE